MRRPTTAKQVETESTRDVSTENFIYLTDADQLAIARELVAFGRELALEHDLQAWWHEFGNFWLRVKAIRGVR